MKNTGIVAETMDSLDRIYRGRIVERKTFFMGNSVYYLEVQNQNNKKTVRQRIGKRRLVLTGGPPPFYFGPAQFNSLEFTTEGLKTNYIEQIVDEGYARTKTFQRRKFPK